jgi:small conductance mechanosensitive channel
VAALKSRIVAALRKAPGTLSDPPAEALISDLSDINAGNVKIRALWWTRAPRQHQMLTSYDAVLTAIQHSLRSSAATPIDHERAA